MIARRPSHAAVPRARPGMTLLELMVAVSIGSILVLSLAGVLGSTSDIYAETERTVETLRDGRATTGILRGDMAGFLGPAHRLPLFHDRNDAKLETRLGFFTAQSSRAQEPVKNSGDLCYAYYYTAVTGDPNGRVSRKLFRKLVSSADTLPMLDGLKTDPPVVTPPQPDPVNDDVIAANVLDFRCEFRNRNAQGAWQVVPNPNDPVALASAAEVVIVLRVLTAGAAVELTSEGDWLPGGTEPKGFDFDSEEDDDAQARTFRIRFNLAQ